MQGRKGEVFKEIQEYMLLTKEENATRTYAGLQKERFFVKVLLIFAVLVLQILIKKVVVWKLTG